MQNLVIIESPGKVKTIKSCLGKNYDVIASVGHVRDLPKSSLGIDVKNGFEPKYVTIQGKNKIISDLKQKAKEADRVYLATDPDRLTVKERQSHGTFQKCSISMRTKPKE